MKQFTKGSLGAVFVLALSFGSGAQADVIWDWSFSGEVGQFITDGAVSGGGAPAGSYNINDFIVTASSVGMAIGSLSGTQYTQNQPVQGFVWDGAQVTQFFRLSGTFTNGSNFFEGPPFTSNWFSFYADATEAEGTIYDADEEFVKEGTLSVRISSVPEPSIVSLLALGLLGLFFRRKRIV